MAVQLTKLKDGVAMGCAFNHALLNGNATWHFMSSWAEICRGAHDISVPPFLERTKARDTWVKLDITIPPEPAAANGDSKAVALPPLREKVFKFTEAAIDKIKSKVNSTNPISDGSNPFSTFQSLSVHIWRQRTSSCSPFSPTAANAPIRQCLRATSET
ncbi:BAHD acyltransferase DCR-like [Cucurbita maxima]|uniref:BAHD acyltransferase DCR-like n=1 Tax=Cucurbita maxima TaxID=3661 RepID=A0A6J1JA33_CUCMA|nr:BAHD acyltransferase DCR-like [Cucurbita maxima]